MTPDEFLTYLRSLVAKHGNQTELAKSIGVTPQYISAIFRHKQEPSPGFLRRLGFERVITYQKSKR